MTPEMARIVAQLRAWHSRSEAAIPAEFARLLGQAESIVGQLLAQLDEEGAGDGPAE